MPILPTYFDPDRNTGGLLGIPASPGGGLPPWLVNALIGVRLGGDVPTQAGMLTGALPPSFAPVVQGSASQAAPSPVSASPPSAPAAGSVLDQARAAIPQGLADNANTLIAFGGGTLRGGIGQGASEAARVGTHEADIAQRRRALAVQQAATIAALRSRGITDAAALAAMDPTLARALLARTAPRPTVHAPHDAVPGEKIVGDGEWQTLPNGVKVREVT